MEVLKFRDSCSTADPHLHHKITSGIEVLKSTLRLFGSPTKRTVFSFNGGKDSTVVLHLLRAALAELAASEATVTPSVHTPPAGYLHTANDSGSPSSSLAVEVVYFETPHNFPEVLEFMAASAARYGFALRRLDGFRAGLAQLVAEGATAVVMGTRADDPDGRGLAGFYTPTSAGWPPALRVCPALDWAYHHVWAFLRGAGLPYCRLYDAGYTSLGATTDSLPNPLLRAPSGSTVTEQNGAATSSAEAAAQYLPAWRLTAAQEGFERLGRAAGRPRRDSDSSSARRRRSSSGGQSAAAYRVLTVAEARAAQKQSLADSHSLRSKRVCVIVIGDEILSGSVADANARFISMELARTDCGASVCEIVVLGDDVRAIAAGVSRASATYDVVITSGGLGCTHDDCTVEGVAAAFDYTCGPAPELADALRSHFVASSENATAASPEFEDCLARMSQIPCGADVDIIFPGNEDDKRAYPLLRVRNVFVLPGIPSAVRALWRKCLFPLLSEAVLNGTASPARSPIRLIVSAPETALASRLRRYAAEHPELKIGSYPSDNISGVPVAITVLPAPASGLSSTALQSSGADLVDMLATVVGVKNVVLES
jgi:FAD synthetase